VLDEKNIEQRVREVRGKKFWTIGYSVKNLSLGKDLNFVKTFSKERFFTKSQYSINPK